MKNLVVRRAALLAFLIASCNEPEPPLSGSVELTLGTVDAAGHGWFPLEGDQPLVPGAQGGFHIWVKYRITGLELFGNNERMVIVKRTARRVSDNRLVLLTQGAQQLGKPDENGMWERPDAIPAFMCPTPIGVEVRDQPLRFHFAVHDAETDELLIEADAEVTPRCPPEGDPQRAFCERICSG